MMNSYGLSKREEEVAELLVKAKSNKQIAMALDISESTVEFHLTKIYTKLVVSSRAEAIIRLSQLWKTPGNGANQKTGEDADAFMENIGESLVEKGEFRADNINKQIPSGKKTTAMTVKTGSGVSKFIIPIGIMLILVVAAVIIFIRLAPKSWTKYERECEYPDESTVGQTIGRSNASGSNVHGQFGTANVTPWSAQSGYVIYKNISTPKVDELYLKVRYSKNSPAAVQISIFLDDEIKPRAAISPKNQGNWNQFAWTEPIFLGRVESGLHSIRFTTDGQQYGVADLDKLILTAGPP